MHNGISGFFPPLVPPEEEVTQRGLKNLSLSAGTHNATQVQN